MNLSMTRAFMSIKDYFFREKIDTINTYYTYLSIGYKFKTKSDPPRYVFTI
ncbi:hypothetical protein R50073_25350 [Maricurvus nonylphenolicus]